MSGKAIREALGVVAVVASLVFVGMEIRQSTVQSKAEAYQAIGFQLYQLHADLAADPHLTRLSFEASDPERMAEWSLFDWQGRARVRVASLRVTETVQLQVEQGLLGSEAVERLGSVFGGITTVPGNACLWPAMRLTLHPSLRTAIEDAYPPQLDCPRTPALDSLLGPLEAAR